MISKLGAGVACVVALCVAGPAIAQVESYGFLDPMGPIARAQRTELIWAAIIIMVAVVPVLIGTPIIFWRYRRSREGSTYRPSWNFSKRLEILQWGVPTVIVIFLSVWMTQAVFLLDPHRTFDAEVADRLDVQLTGEPVRVDVVGLDWKWLFLYPEEGVASVGEMVIPVGRPVALRLTTDTVMQSFMAPGLAGQIYAMAGMTTQMSFLADRPGVTMAGNTQYNGTGFPGQRVPVRAVDDLEFAQWLGTAQDGPELNATTYAQLAVNGDHRDVARQFGQPDGSPVVFDLTETALFDRVIARYMNGEAVPPEKQPGSPSYNPDISIPPDPMPRMHH